MADAVKESENRALLEYFARNPDIVPIRGADGFEAIAVPNGRQVICLDTLRDNFRTEPRRALGVSTHSKLSSFIEHVKRFKDEGTALFVDVSDKTEPDMTAVYDYNTGAGKPRFGGHRARYAFPLSEEWVAWTRAFAQGLDQKAFAELLEERMSDILDPDNATAGSRAALEEVGIILAGRKEMLALSKGLAVTVNANVKEARRLDNGAGVLSFEESQETKDLNGAPVRVPGGFILAIPVFEFGEPFSVAVRLRYRVTSGRPIRWEMVPTKIGKVFEVATSEAANLAATETGCPLFFGTPEA